VIRVAPLADADAIDRILTDPWIAPKLRHDAREPGFIDHPAAHYWGAWVDGELVGVFLAIRASPWEVEVHAGLLRHAVRHSRALAQAFIAEQFADPELLRLTAYVIGDLPSAANWCRRLGFVDEGARRNAVVKSGKVLDVHVLRSHARGCGDPALSFIGDIIGTITGAKKAAKAANQAANLQASAFDQGIAEHRREFDTRASTCCRGRMRAKPRWRSSRR
jgi:hypothetical protein